MSTNDGLPDDDLDSDDLDGDDLDGVDGDDLDDADLVEDADGWALPGIIPFDDDLADEFPDD